MNQQNIKLPDFLLADMYKSSLVEIESKIMDKPIANENAKDKPGILENIKLLGKNSKNVIVVTNYTEVAFLPDNELLFLTNILKACNLNLSDIGIANYATHKIHYNLLKEKLGAKKIILFGLKASDVQLPFTVPDFQVQQYDECSILQAPALGAMNEDTASGKNLKMKLWIALKQMFGIQ